MLNIKKMIRTKIKKIIQPGKYPKGQRETEIWEGTFFKKIFFKFL